jgi:hypothetical protein
MPQQEVFLDERVGNKHVQVLKTYDAAFAREAFDVMDAQALKFLSVRLGAEDLPAPDSPDFTDSIWQELEDGAREDWNKFSYFVVTEDAGNRPAPVFVSADWPSAEAFARTLAQFGKVD